MNLTKEEQHDADNYNAACQKGHENVTEETNVISKRTLKYVKYILLMVITWFCSVEYDRYFGSFINGGLSRQQVELENYVLTSDDVSTEHIWRVVDEKDMQIKRMRTKLNYKQETHKIMLGFLTNEARYLEHALSINPDRENGFPFVDWSQALVETLLDFALDASHYDVLSWVAEQPGWDTVVSKALSKKIIRRINGSSPPKTSALTRAEREKQKEKELLARLHPYWKKHAGDLQVSVWK